MTREKKIIKLEAVRYCLAGLTAVRLDAGTAYELAEILRVARAKLLKQARKA